MPFVIAEVSKPIIGADFLFRFNLAVDLRGQQLIEKHHGHFVRGTVRRSTQVRLG
jgi:hypothetical protein